MFLTPPASGNLRSCESYPWAKNTTWMNLKNGHNIKILQGHAVYFFTPLGWRLWLANGTQMREFNVLPINFFCSSVSSIESHPMSNNFQLTKWQTWWVSTRKNRKPRLSESFFKYFWRIMYHLPLAKILHPKTAHLANNWHLDRKFRFFLRRNLTATWCMYLIYSNHPSTFFAELEPKNQCWTKTLAFLCMKAGTY